MIFMFINWKKFYLKYRTYKDMYPEVHEYQGTIIIICLRTKIFSTLCKP